ncbi:conjugal transfer protein TrbI [Gluconacetobacter sacchari DSM 12717]|uniref:TrbI/VirB10 family protein n=2 Tax=Gluconacetobacter sacchari TaxID=92759 RepID=A0A7W4IFG7_9PROT|nr:TrbI/VirB10 family protein [Gluconacetobacter sacchari]MBB2161809.1 TrbI/VirB10 family protein [Gluconacetobacter sacchari]GBQ20203.1 conjugal transfer protein TrbI [Gluconacetobacter sacchari DSM 12717]
MSDEPASDGRPEPVVPPPDLRLRGDRPRVVRLSRRVVWSLGGVGAIAVAFALVYALQASHHAPSASANQDNASRLAAAGLEALPKDYAGVPKLGPALPGDLGRPILNAQQQGKSIPLDAIGNDDARRAQQEIIAAIGSKLFVQVGQGDRGGGTAAPMVGAEAGPGNALRPSDTDPQAGNRAFLAHAVDHRMVSLERIVGPASPYILQAGTIIAGALNTAVNSGLPGQLTGHVTQNVYDSPTGRYLLIPQGSTLVGQYSSAIAFGQDRTLVIWTRLIFPDGKSIVLENLPGADAIGHAGLSDQIDRHWGELFKAALVTTMLSVGSEAGTSFGENNLMQAIRSGVSNGFSMVGNRLIDRSLNVQPTLTDRPGLPFTVVLNRDLALRPRHETER